MEYETIIGLEVHALTVNTGGFKAKELQAMEEKAYSDELAGKTEDAIETWKSLLEIDPGNIPAQLSIRRLSP